MSGIPLGVKSRPSAEVRKGRDKAVATRWFRWAVAMALASSVGVLAWNGMFRDRIVPKRWGVVVPGRVYRSGQLSEHLVERQLLEHRIKTVVDLQSIDPACPGQAAELDAARRNGVEIVRCPLAGDGTGDIRQYAEAIATIDRCERVGRPVLVHCAAGSQRTGGVVAAYRILVRRESPEAAYSELREYGWDPRKDRKLIEYVNGQMAELARLLAERDVIECVPDPLPALPSS